MSESANILPSGFQDVLAPHAETEFKCVSELLKCFLDDGYKLVSPPMVEFENTQNNITNNQAFHVMDPASKQVMFIRPDMTSQVARLASLRLKNEARPLKLCYSGQVLRVAGEGLFKERQLTQAGVEYIGADDLSVDFSVISLGVKSLLSLGFKSLSLDLSLPSLLIKILAELGVRDNSALQQFETAIDTKDDFAINKLCIENDIPENKISEFKKLIFINGDADKVLNELKTLGFSCIAEVISDIENLIKKLSTLKNVNISLDILEKRGSVRHSGFSFSFFSQNVREELGKGGRYSIQTSENAVGFTFSVNAICRALA